MSQEHSTIRAVVRALNGDQAIVEVEHGGCGRCHEKGGCGGQRLTQMLCSGPKTFHVDNQAGALVGESVTVAIAAGSVRRTANLAYGVPLFATLVGAALGAQFGGDLIAMLGGVIGVSLSVFYVRIRSQNGSGNITERPYIISRS